MTSSRAKARTWPYPRQRHFRAKVKEAAAAWFRAQNAKVRARTPYILAQRGDWASNIIKPEVAQLIREIQAERAALGQGFALHRSVHHGLSSQALLFNLIGPLIVKDDLDILKPVLEDQGISCPTGRLVPILEYEDRDVFNEDYGQPTSIDLVLQNAEGEPFLFVECKFVEPEFGGCSLYGGGDCDGRNPATNLSLCYLHYIGRRYWELLGKHGFLNGPMSQERLCVLASHYQFFRCLLFALEKGASFALLYDERSPTFDHNGPQGRRGLLPYLLCFVPEALLPRVAGISIQQVVAAIEDSGRHPWIEEFRKKYGLA